LEFIKPLLFFVANVISRNRFKALMSFLYVVDKEAESQLKANNDKLAKVRPLSDSLNKNVKNSISLILKFQSMNEWFAPKHTSHSSSISQNKPTQALVFMQLQKWIHN